MDHDDFILVTAPNLAMSYDYMAELNKENIGCAISEASAQDVVDIGAIDEIICQLS